ncbi:hypothetical protein VTH06DRAFT_5599 [Thermothelomyces fergusii]
MTAPEKEPGAPAPAASEPAAEPAPAVEAADAASSTPATTAPEASGAPEPETAQTAPAGPAAPATAPEAAAAAPTAEEKKEPTPETPIGQLWAVAKASGHPEIWGVTLADPSGHVPTRIILQKYLNANDGDLAKAKDQLAKTLEWRAKTKPLELVGKVFSKAKFDGLGYVTRYQEEGSSEPEGREVFTWNIYGGVKSIEETFGKLDEFLEWRVALMELALQELDIASATREITAEYDPYKMFQVHDYKSISFLRQSPQFFVNVPAIMGFVYAFMKLFVAPKTIKKFHPMSNGQNLAAEFAGSKVSKLGERLPSAYGGKGAKLEEQGKGPLLE